MLTKPTRQQLRSLYSLSKTDAWTEIDKIFQTELDKTYENLAEGRDDATLHRLQGRAQLIREFRVLVREAPSLLEKLGETTL